MPPIDLVLHLLNFMAPAAFVSAVTVVLSRLGRKNQASRLRLWPQLAINFAVCLSVLLAGLWFFGRDGKMVSYAALVFVSATCQWAMVWRIRAIN
jgi:hypothetical protein